MAIALNSSGILSTPIYQPQYKLVPKPMSWSLAEPDPMSATFDYEVVRVPTQVPYVAHGNHPWAQPHDMRVGCTMELVSALAGERWTDRPMTAHPMLGHVMIGINDMLPDQPRQKMLELVPRLVGTNELRGIREFELLIHDLEQQVFRTYMGMPYGEIEHLLKSAHYLLDVADRHTGRPTQRLDEQTLTRLMTALAA